MPTDVKVAAAAVQINRNRFDDDE